MIFKDVRKSLIREYVSEIIKEDDGGGYTGGGGEGAYGYDLDSPYGVNWGGPSLLKIFVEPFTDVLKTAKAGVEQISATTRAGLKIALEAAVSTVVPVFIADFKKIFDKEKDELRKIKEKYRDVFERTDKALANDEVLIWSFLMNPTAVITAKTLKAAPEAALEIFKVLAGRSPELLKYLENVSVELKNSLDKDSDKNKRQKDYSIWSDGGGKRPQVRKQGSGGGLAIGGAALLAMALNKPEVQKSFSRSPIVASMKSDAMKSLNATMSDIKRKLKDLDSIQTPEQAKAKFPGIDISKYEALSPQEKKQIAPAVVSAIKNSGKNVFKKSLEAHMAHALELGLPETHPFVLGYKKMIDGIR